MELGQGDGPPPSIGFPTERGYAMAALLVGMSVMAVLMTMAMPVWSQFAKREKETELIWRGQQYARAIGLFQRKYANTFPPTVDVLIEQKFLRKKYKDPVTSDDFQLIPAGGGGAPAGGTGGPGGFYRGPIPGGVQPPAQGQQGQGGFPAGGIGQPTQPGGGAGPAAPSIGIQGVVSKSKDTSIKIFNGRTKYNEWAFVYLATARTLAPNQQPSGPQNPSGRPPAAFGPDGRPGPGTSPGGQPSPFSPPSPFGGGGSRPPVGAPGFPSQPPPQRPPGR